MKRKFVLLLVALLSVVVLCGCSKKASYNPQYGVSYTLENLSSVCVKLDEKDSNTITVLRVVVVDKDLDFDKLFPTDKVNKSWCTDISISENYPITFKSLNQEGDNQDYETIVLCFYRDDFDSKDAASLIDYLGLNEELKDGKLTYQELLSSKTFKFKNILDNGAFCNNISFNKEDKYTYKGK